MSGSRDHYERLLAPVYTWMSGGAAGRFEANRAFFRDLGIHPRQSRIALDLGAGSGFQSIPLAELGFHVTAVDLSATLLAELRSHAGTLPVRTVERDLFPIASLTAPSAELVVCMGDTLTHFPAPSDVGRLIAEAADVLSPGGTLVLTWRDLTRIPAGDARFLPIRSSPDRIFTCFLEAVDENFVRVHDIVHERTATGFAQQVSSYLKLRVAPESVDRELAASGLDPIAASADRGWITRVARKPA